MPLFLSLYVFSLLGFFIHLYMDNFPKSKGRIVELLLLYQLVFSVGMTSILAFIGLTLMPVYIAEYTSWPPCPFEQQLANVNLGYGVLGILCCLFRRGFWVATIIGFSVWILLDGVHHLSDMVLHNNYSWGNIGVPLITDIAVPLALVILLVLYIKWNSPLDL